MNSLRKVFGSLIAVVVLAAFALPADAAKLVSLPMPVVPNSGGIPLTSAATQIEVTISNDGNSNANSFEVDFKSANFSVTGGYVKGDTSNVGTLKSTGVYGSPYKGIVFNKQAPAKATVTVVLSVSVTQSCPSDSVTWQVAAWTGSPGPLSTSFTSSGPWTTAIATGAGSCGTLSIDTRGSAVLNTAFTVTVNLNGGPGGADVNLVSSTLGCSYTGGGTLNAGSGGHSVTYSSFTLTNSPASHVCTITATDPTGGYSSASKDIYIGTLDCNNSADPSFPPYDSTAAGYFSGSPAGVSLVTQPGFAAGYRVKNKNDETCQLVNYTFTNNILNTGTATDASGNTLPPNSASHVWDEAFQPHAAYVYVLTFKPEYVNATTGLPENQTKFCDAGAGNTDCRAAGGKQKSLKACIGTALNNSSIPGDDPACSIEETWIVVPTSECGTDTNRACVRPSVRILDARDPPIIRG